ncbi:MAG: hypothetical protein WC890_07765 [Candidatus Margulisiibacteriota bacterium]
MKKFIICLVVFVFTTTIASVAFGRTMDEEKQAVRDYLNVLDAKLAKAKAAKQSAKVNMLHIEKTATLARWNKLKASMVVAPVPPTPVVVQPVSTQYAGLFGWGLNTIFSGQYIYTGSGSISGAGGLKGDIVLDDFIGLGPMLSLSNDTFKYKLGLGVYDGGGSGLKAIPVYAGGIINLGADVYLTGGLNYVIYGNGQTSGRIGGDAYIGLKTDIGLGAGATRFELGYSAVRSSTVTAKGFAFSVNQAIVL